MVGESDSDKVTLPDDSMARLKRAIDADLRKIRDGKLNKDQPDEVVKKWSPLNEKKAMKGFHFYVQSLKGKTPIWDEMITGLKPVVNKQLTGIVFPDGYVVWSEDAVLHSHLAVASGKNYSDAAAQFQSSYPLGSSQPEIKIFWFSEDAMPQVKDYFERSVSKEVPVSILAQSAAYNPKNNPVQIR